MKIYAVTAQLVKNLLLTRSQYDPIKIRFAIGERNIPANPQITLTLNISTRIETLQNKLIIKAGMIKRNPNKAPIAGSDLPTRNGMIIAAI